MSTSASIRARASLAVVSTLVSGLAAFWIWWGFLAPAPNYITGIGVIHGGAIEVDETVGTSPRKSTVVQGHMGPLLGDEVEVFRHQNNLSLIREDDLHGELTGPRILVLGDSHMMGILNTSDNATTLLEERLRKEPGMSGALVLNAACHDYTLYQYVLRYRTLSERLKPDLILVVVFMGNDFLGLEDTRRPHLDDTGQERPISDNAPPETTTKRMRELELDKPGTLIGLFWQGLNQAYYFHQRSERLPFIKKKTTRALQLLKAEAKQSEADLMIVMLPSFDLVMPEKVRILNNKRVLEAVDSGLQGQFYAWFRTALQSESIDYIDLLPALRKDGRQELFSSDLHLWIPGHRLLAAAVGERVLDCLRARTR